VVVLGELSRCIGAGAFETILGISGFSAGATSDGLRPNSLARNLNILSPSVDFPSGHVAKTSQRSQPFAYGTLLSSSQYSIQPLADVSIHN